MTITKLNSKANELISQRSSETVPSFSMKMRNLYAESMLTSFEGSLYVQIPAASVIKKIIIFFVF